MYQYKVELGEISYLFNKLPKHIVDKIYLWALRVEMIGLLETRKISSFHDEPLKGKRRGQRSIRLNLDYRLFYVEDLQSNTVIVKAIEVNNHEY